METISCQPLLDRLTTMAIKSKSLEKFDKLNTTFDQVKFCHGTTLKYDGKINIKIKTEIHQLLEPLFDAIPEHEKSERLAVKAKEEGTKLYCQKKDYDAINLYTTCLRLAPPESKLIPLAFANRSAVLFKIEQYEACLQDITMALSLGYPDDLAFKLYFRRMNAHIKLHKFLDAEAMFEEAYDSVKLSPTQGQNKLLNQLEDLKKEITKAEKKEDERGDSVDPELFNIDFEEHSTVKYMTKCFDLRFTKDEGRHIVSNSTVERGTVVFSELPFASVLLPEHFYTNCYKCFNSTINPIPCMKCCDVVYCSEDCRKESWTCHRYECCLLHIITSVGIAHLALNVLLVAGWKTHSIIKNEEEPPSSISGCGVNDTFNGPSNVDKYRAVYHLMTHLDQALPEDNFQYAIAAILLSMTVLEKTTLQQDWALPTEDSLSLHLLAGGIMHHIAQLVTNAHAITQISAAEGNNSTEEINQVRVASAIYPTASMMNHSCQPTIIVSYIKDRLIIRTIEDVKPGDQIYNCYGPHYCRHNYEERQSSLKQQYFFTCKCLQCCSKERKLIEASWSGVICEKCKGIANYKILDEDAAKPSLQITCLECHEIYSSSKMDKKYRIITRNYNEGLDCIKNGNTERGRICLQNACYIGDEFFNESNIFLHEMRDAILQTYISLELYVPAINLGLPSLNFINKHYGKDSVEMGHEYLKVISILTKMDGKEREDRQHILDRLTLRVNELFVRIYGTRWRQYLKLPVT